MLLEWQSGGGRWWGGGGGAGEVIHIHTQCFSKRVTDIPNTMIFFKFRVPGGAEMHFQ